MHVRLRLRHLEAGQRSDVIYAVLGICRRHGINPVVYLQDIFERQPKAKTSEVPSLTSAAHCRLGLMSNVETLGHSLPRCRA